MSFIDIEKETRKFVANTYSRQPISIASGNGVYLTDSEGKQYLDLTSGIAGANPGYGHPHILEIVHEQSKKLMHCSNLFYIAEQSKLARFLVENSFGEKCFFCNSGTESVEAAVKFARLYGTVKKNIDHPHIIAFERAFHGRTLGALSHTHNPKYRDGFGPLFGDVSFVPLNDFSAVENAVSKNTVAILLEPIQGEGGVYEAEKEFLEKLRVLADREDILLIFDEVQTGMGRTGKLFAYQHSGVEPDLLCLAKGIAGGLPMGAVILGAKPDSVVVPGCHASTFGGNPLVCAVAMEVFKIMFRDHLIERAEEIGKKLKNGLEEIAEEIDCVGEIRGKGLMVGADVSMPASSVVDAMREQGILILTSGENTIRFLPPLILQPAHIQEALGKLKEVLKKLSEK